MKHLVASLLALLGAACAPPALPTFAPGSPARASAPSAFRPPVAAVLAARDPLEAAVCAPRGPCVLSAAVPAPAGQDHSMHHHHHDAGGAAPQGGKPDLTGDAGGQGHHAGHVH